MTEQQHHLSETLPLFIVSFTLLLTFTGQRLGKVRTSPLQRQKKRVSEGKMKKKPPCLLSKINVDMSKMGLCANCITGKQRIAPWFLQRGLFCCVALHDVDKSIEEEL